jgi:4-hydroxythreonine-4-phosphate dehydrogenase
LSAQVAPKCGREQAHTLALAQVAQKHAEVYPGTPKPAVERLRAEGHDVRGPLPGDTVFHRHLQGEFDAVAAIYHDQGLAPLKTVDFSTAANLSLGLRHIRTSPDHGTAYGLAGQGTADRGSFDAAVRLAFALTV